MYVYTYIFIYNIFPCNAMHCDRQKPIDASDLSSCKNDGGSQMRQINIDRNQCKSSTLHCGKCHFHFLINWVLLKWSQQQEGWHPSSDQTNQYRSITINASPTHWWRKINQSRLISELETRLQRSIGESHLPFILSYISLKSHIFSYLILYFLIISYLFLPYLLFSYLYAPSNASNESKRKINSRKASVSRLPAQIFYLSPYLICSHFTFNIMLQFPKL